MVVDKHNVKRTDRQQLRNPNVRQELKRLSDTKGLERQSILQPSSYERLEGIGGKKRGGKTYHSPKYQMVPSLNSGGRKHKIMKDTEEPKKGRGRPKKQVKKVESESDYESDYESDEEPKPKRKTGRGKLEITHYEGGAKMLGKSFGEELTKDKDFNKLIGSGLFGKFLEGLNEFAKGVAVPVKLVGKIAGDVVPPLKVAGKLVDKVDDPKWLKELKGKGKGGKLGSPLQVENPNVKGNGIFDNFGLRKDFSKLGNLEQRKGSILKNKGSGRKLSKGASDWIQFVKKVAKDKGITYPEALKVASKMRK